MSVLRLLAKPSRLPDAAYVELVGLLLAGRLPIAVMALTVAAVAVLATHDALTLSCAGVVLALLAARTGLVTRFMALGAVGVDAARRWEARYAAIVLPYAAALGLFNFHVTVTGTEAARLLVVAETYGFCAGMVSRGFVRPRLCAIMVLIGALPTAAAFLILALHIGGSTGLALGVVGALFAIYAVSSLETVAHLYRAMLAQLATKRHLADLARLDALTGLPNRLAMRELLAAELAKEARGAVALLLIDLDGFKGVNDRHGHPAGDRLLAQVAGRLTASLRAGDFAARLGGDEFAIVQRALARPDEALALANRAVAALSLPYADGGATLTIGASCGIAIAAPDVEDIELLIERADSALYRAKRHGGDAVRLWRSSPKLKLAA